MLPNKQKIMESILNKKEENLFSIGTVVTVDPYTIKFPPDDTAIPAIATTSLYNISVGSRVTVLRYGKQYIIQSVLGNPANKYQDYVVKTTEEFRNNTSTVSDDNELTLTLPANGIFKIEMRLFVDAVSSTPDFKCKFDTSNVTQLSYRAAVGQGTSNTGDAYNANYSRWETRSLNSEAGYGLTNVGWGVVKEDCLVSTSSNTGTITLQWAQFTATAENISVKPGSWLKYIRIDSFPYAGSGSLQDILDDIDDLETDVASNTSDISTNTSNISTNTSDISTNTSDISTNTSDISDLESDKQDNIVYRVKTADESITSSTTLQNDNHLYIDINTDGVYEVQISLDVRGSQSGDIIVDWSTTNGVSTYENCNRHNRGPAQSTTSGYTTSMKCRCYALTDDVTYGVASTSYGVSIKENFLVQKSGTAGRLQLRWAQDVSNATATTVKEGSYMTIKKLTSSSSI